MKLYQIYILFTLIVFTIILFNSCSDDNSNINNTSPEYISVSPQIFYSPARIVGTEFEEGDKIGLFVVPYLDAENTTPGNIEESDYAVNIEHIYNGMSWLQPSGERIYWPPFGRHVDLYAYFPYTDGCGEINPLSVPFTIKSDQRTKEQYQASDFLWSKRTSVAPTKDPVELIFSHKLSKIRINIKSEIAIPDEDFKAATVSLLGTNGTAIVNLSDGNVLNSPGSLINEILAFHHVTPAAGYKISAEAILIPQLINRGNPFIRILMGNGSSYSYIPSDNLLFETGKERTFNITIIQLGISVTVGSITDWQPSDIIDGEIGNPVPKVLDLSQVDLNQSFVHNIYDNGVLIGQVCREYIFRNGTFDFPATTIYKINTEGAIDESNAFVAQVMKRNRNTTTNQYEPNTGNIHGGTVLWGANNTLSSYTAGNLPLINKVELSATGIKAANDNAIVTLTLSPARVSDVDNNSYSIVKVSSQYWTSENLKTEHHRDGSDLTYYYYDDNLANKNLYGGLYTWSTVIDSRGICPQGWHVPVNDEFVAIYQYLTPNAGMKMKANILWTNLNNNDNVSGFSGTPGGRRTNTGTYTEIGNYGQWWTSTETSTTNAYRLYLSSGDNAMHNETISKTFTQSVRCVRDF